MKWIINFTFYFISTFAFAQYKIEVLDSNTFHLGDRIILSKISFRGLSVVDDQIVWLSGSRGTIARSTDGGKTFSFQQIKGYEKSDFRDIEAFDDKHAIIMSSGTPAYILKTTDGGQTWKEVYKNTDTAYFLDAMDFWNDKQGIIVGDPVKGHFILLQTNDSGETWQQMDANKTPESMPGEAIFAASGTSLRCTEKFGGISFVTGGKISRIIGADISREYLQWKSFELKITQGKQSQGAFSFSGNKAALIIVGGDYSKDTLVNMNSAIQYYLPRDNDEIWDKIIDDVKGYRSCIEAIDEKKFICCGTTGIDIYKNKYWQNISQKSFNVVRKAKKGKTIFLAGGNGRIARLIY